jgi:hypothetical protein
VYPVNDYPWLLFDEIARVSVGDDPLQKQHDATGLQLWTTESVPESDDNWDPPNYEDEYKKLWHVS